MPRQSQHASSSRFTPNTGSFPMTSLYLIGFIEDTKGPFIFRLGGELEVINVLCNNLPVGDEVALEVTSSQCRLDTKLKTCFLPLSLETLTTSLCSNPKVPQLAPGDALAEPRCLRFLSEGRNVAGCRTTYLFTFLASTCSLFTPQNGWTPFWFGDQTRALFPGS